MTTTIDLTAIKKSGAPKKVIEVYEYLKVYMGDSRRADWIKLRQENWKVVGENIIWTSEEEKEFKDHKQIPIVDNKCKKGVQGKCAIVTDQKPEIKFFPIGSADLYVSELCKRAHDVVWAKNDGSDVVYDFAEESTVSGVGVVQAFHDPNKGLFGKQVFEELDPDDCYWDADSRKKNWSDTNVIIGKLRTKGYIKERYPELSDDDLHFYAVLKEEKKGGMSEGVTSGDNYAFAESQKLKDTTPEQGQEEDIWEIWAWMVKIEQEDWVIHTDPETGLPVSMPLEVGKDEEPEEAGKRHSEAMGGQFIKYWPRQKEKRIVRHIVGKAIIKQEDDEGNELDEIKNPYGEDADGDPIMPVIPLLGQRNKNGLPNGVVTFAKDLNRVSSKAFMNFFHAAAHLINAPIVRPEGSAWDGVPGTPGSELKVSVNATFQPYRLSPGSMQIQQWMNIKTEADNDINEQFDTPDVMKGKVPEGQDNMSGRLGLALQDMAGMMSNPFMRSVESALERLAKVNMALIFRYWPRYMWERLLEESELTSQTEVPTGGSPEEVKKFEGEEPQEIPEGAETATVGDNWKQALDIVSPIDEDGKPTGEGIQVIDLDIRIAAGSSMPTNRMAKMAFALDMVEAGIYDPQAVLEMIDDPKKDEIMARQKKAAQAAAEAEMMKKATKGK